MLLDMNTNTKHISRILCSHTVSQWSAIYRYLIMHIHSIFITNYKEVRHVGQICYIVITEWTKITIDNPDKLKVPTWID